MLFFEVMKHRRKLEPIIQQTWKRIGKDIPYPQVAEDNAEQKLIYFGMIAYAMVYESGLAAGMSTSAAHYLSRMQVGKYKLGKSTTRVVEDIFTGHENDDEKIYADFFLTRLAQIIKIVKSGEGEVEPLMLELAQAFKTTKA